MVERLPDFLDPFEYAERKRRVKGSVPLDRMDRLGDSLVNRQGEARIEFEFKKEGRVVAITGRVEAELVLCCQCCLEPLAWPVGTDVYLGVVGSIDEADLLPEGIEPIIVERGGNVALMDIVEDELLLAIPVIPRHSACGLPKPEASADAAEHPFAALAHLKNNR